jgi:hypothetical protein
MQQRRFTDTITAKNGQALTGMQSKIPLLYYRFTGNGNSQITRG